MKPVVLSAAGFTLYAPSAASTTALTAMDLPVHRGIKMVTQGKSYRLESFLKRVKNRAAAGMSSEEA